MKKKKPQPKANVVAAAAALPDAAPPKYCLVVSGLLRPADHCFKEAKDLFARLSDAGRHSS